VYNIYVENIKIIGNIRSHEDDLVFNDETHDSYINDSENNVALDDSTTQ
jgi:hypothetical protein